MSDAHEASPHPTRSFVLEDWEIVSLPNTKGAVKLCLSGLAFGGAHPVAGVTARTSAIVRYRMQGKRLIIVTQSGSEYMLGMRDTPQEDDKRRLIRYLDVIASVRNKAFAQADSDIHTDFSLPKTAGWPKPHLEPVAIRDVD
jgi:hypothetical protein